MSVSQGFAMFATEALETRALFSGNVSVYTSHGGLHIDGDSKSNVIVISGASHGGFIVTGSDGTTINGASSLTTDGVARPTYVDLGDGNDSVSLNGVPFADGVSVDLGSGNDTFYAAKISFSAVDVDGGSGKDTIGFSDDTFAKWLSVLPGDGADKTGMVDLHAKRGFEIDDGGAAAHIDLQSVLANEPSWITTGGGNDHLSITASHFQSFNAKTRGGNDSVIVRSTAFDTYSPIDGGSGQNDIDREVDTSWDFTGGDAQGWMPMLLGRDPSKDNTPVTEQEFAASQPGGSFGIAADPLDANSSVYQFSYRYLAYLFVPVKPSSGLLPNQQYTVSIQAEAYSAFGLDESRLSAGATAAYPNIRSESTSDNSLNGETLVIDGAQYPLAEFDRSGKPISNVAHDGMALYVCKTASPAIVTTDGQGNAWIVLEFRNGDEEGGDTFQFKSVSVAMTPVTT